MMDDEFEWDDAKAARNKRVHRIGFDKARRVFEDAFAYDWPETSHVGPEQHRITVGMAGYTMLVVVYTHRSDRIRIISARRAGHHERKAYNDGHLA